jgi:V8-like Glu-specific endopeptidase
MTDASGYFRNSKNEISEHTSSIVPLISENKNNNRLFFIGTAFYISGLGILMTAKHNLFDKNAKFFDNLGVYNFLPDNQYILRPIRKLIYSNDYDIAYLLPEEIKYKGTELVLSQSLVLTDSTPKTGEQLGTYGYPNSKMDNYRADFNAKFYKGNCTKFHPNGFSILKNPCYQTTILIMGGASGGPVFDKDGKVFAVCSTGYDLIDGEENISLVTPISPSFSMTIEDGKNETTTISNLIERKIIVFEKNACS